MAISSINSGASNPYLDQNTKQADSTKQPSPTITTPAESTSTKSVSQTSLGDGSNNKPSSITNTNNQNTSSVKVNDTLTKESQFTASFQKSQLLSKLPSNAAKDTTSQPANSSTVKETSVVSLSKELGDYGHLSTGQKKLIDDLNNRQNAADKTKVSPSEFYNKLEPSQKSTFESVTNALENTTIIGKDGAKTNALDTIERVDVILGEKPGSSNGAEQFRLLVTIKDGASDNVQTAKNFYKVPGHGDEYPIGRQLKGGEPSIQFCFTKDGKRADIDVDYESKNAVVNVFNGFKHLQTSNSDVRHDNHFEKHNKKFASEPGQEPLVKKY